MGSRSHSQVLECRTIHRERKVARLGESEFESYLRGRCDFNYDFDMGVH